MIQPKEENPPTGDEFDDMVGKDFEPSQYYISTLEGDDKICSFF